MPASFTDVDRGYRRFLRAVKALRKPVIDVGFRQVPGWGEWTGPVPDNDPGITLIASVHEFGDSRGRVPARPFLRRTLEEQADKTAQRIGNAVQRYIDGADLEAEFGRVGAWFVGEVQRTIVRVVSPPLAQSTLKAKRRRSGKRKIKIVNGIDTGNPLIDTGRMRQSVDYVVRRKV